MNIFSFVVSFTSKIVCFFRVVRLLAHFLRRMEYHCMFLLCYFCAYKTKIELYRSQKV